MKAQTEVRRRGRPTGHRMEQAEERRRVILAEIAARAREGWGSTQADLAKATGLHKSNVQYHLGLLKADGLIERQGRNWRLVSRSQKVAVRTAV